MRNARRGFTLVEVVIAMTLFALIAIAISQGIYFISRQGQNTRHRGFATQKAIQMMEELRGVVTGNGNIAILDNYNDGLLHNPVLTTNLNVTNPADASSGNGDGSLYRIVTVVYLPNDPNSREVYVRVYDTKTNAPLAQTMSILRTLPNKFYPSEVYDVYLLALENVPGWWALAASLHPIVDTILQNLQTINPGLVMRTHWVTQLAYGRDPYYAPYLNAKNLANTANIPNAYYYPGLVYNTNKQANIYYYDPGFINGKLITDSPVSPTVQNGSSYALADEFNHGMRYPDEWAAYQAAVSSAVANGNAPPEISLRILLEQMNQNPSPLQNLLVMNMHGEMLPLPPMRNYSDPAKDPANYPGVRVVTHPQWLSYPSGREVKLRVYSFVSPEYLVSTASGATLSAPISVYFPSDNIATGNISVRRLTGGTTSYTYQWINGVNANGNCSGPPNNKQPNFGDDWCAYQSGGATEIVISTGSPLRAMNWPNPPNPINYYGVSSSMYGMEYIPSPPQAITTLNVTGGTSDFIEGQWDLADNTSTVPANTARWVIKIAAGALANGQHQVQTRVNSDLTAGPGSANPNELPNQSNTYVWIGTAVPTTEQYQFMGDPRYEPYADSKFNNNYNWDFIDISTATNGAGYAFQGYYEANNANSGGGNGWYGMNHYDIARYYQMYRQGLLNAGGVWSTMSGFAFYYSAIGGDMGDDGFLGFCQTPAAGPCGGGGSGNAGLQLNDQPWSNANHNLTMVRVAEILGGRYWGGASDASEYNVAYAHLVTAATSYWVANPWVGDLYPDAYFTGASGWAATGNLPTAAVANAARTGFYRSSYTATYGQATNTWTYPFQPQKRVMEAAGIFVNGYPSGGPTNELYTHISLAGTDASLLTSTGTLIASVFNYALLPSLQAARPFQLTTSIATPNPNPSNTWTNPYYLAQRTQTSILNTAYSDTTEPTYTSAGLVKVQSSSGTATYLAVNGMGSQGSFGSNDITQLGLSTMLYGFMGAGAPTNPTGTIHQVPLVVITTPTVTQEFLNPSNVTIAWVANWTRWNGLAYTGDYPVGYTDGTVTILYNVKYSADGGGTWKNVSDGTPATFGTYDGSHQMTSPVIWNVSGFPQANYLIVVEAYRQGFPLHYSFQEMSVYIQY